MTIHPHVRVVVLAPDYFTAHAHIRLHVPVTAVCFSRSFSSRFTEKSIFLAINGTSGLKFSMQPLQKKITTELVLVLGV